MDNNLDQLEVKQEFCKKCGGIARVLVGNREIGWKESMLRLIIGAHAWCICG